MQWCMPKITATWEAQAGMIACIQGFQACLKKKGKKREGEKVAFVLLGKSKTIIEYW